MSKDPRPNNAEELKAAITTKWAWDAEFWDFIRCPSKFKDLNTWKASVCVESKYCISYVFRPLWLHTDPQSNSSFLSIWRWAICSTTILYLYISHWVVDLDVGAGQVVQENLPVFRWRICVFQGGNSKAKDRKKGESSLQEVKRRGRMERSRVEEEDMSDKLKMLVRFQLSCF